MSDMADHIGEVPISCTKLFIRYCIHYMDIAISAVYTPYFGV